MAIIRFSCSLPNRSGEAGFFLMRSLCSNRPKYEKNDNDVLLVSEIPRTLLRYGTDSRVGLVIIILICPRMRCTTGSGGVASDDARQQRPCFAGTVCV